MSNGIRVMNNPKNFYPNINIRVRIVQHFSSAYIRKTTGERILRKILDFVETFISGVGG